MSYNRKSRYPSVKTPGVYRDATDEQLGLDADNLQELSLGNWNSIYKGNKLFLSGNLLEKIKTSGGIEVKFRTSPPKQGTRVLVWRYKRNDEQTSTENAILLAQGPIIEYLSEVENISASTVSLLAGLGNDDEGVKLSRLLRTRAVYNQFYNSVLPAIDNDNPYPWDKNGNDLSISVLDNQSFTNKAITFEDGRAIIQEREGGDIVLTLDEDTRFKLEQHHVFERELDEVEQRGWGGGAPERGNDQDFTHELIVMVDFDIQALTIASDTLEEFESQSWDFLKPNDGDITGNLSQQYMNNYPQSNAGFITLRGLEKNLFDGPDKASVNHPFIATNHDWGSRPQGKDFFQDSPHYGGYGYYHSEADFKANIGAVDWNPGYRTDIKLGANFWPDELKFSDEDTNDIGDRGLLPQKGDY